MTVNDTQLKSLIGPVWQEISSLWSGVDFSFGDPLPESTEPKVSATKLHDCRSQANRF
jgi:hypothetical protein